MGTAGPGPTCSDSQHLGCVAVYVASVTHVPTRPVCPHIEAGCTLCEGVSGSEILADSCVVLQSKCLPCSVGASGSRNCIAGETEASEHEPWPTICLFPLTVKGDHPNSLSFITVTAAQKGQCALFLVASSSLAWSSDCDLEALSLACSRYLRMYAEELSGPLCRLVGGPCHHRLCGKSISLSGLAQGPCVIHPDCFLSEDCTTVVNYSFCLALSSSMAGSFSLNS